MRWDLIWMAFFSLIVGLGWGYIWGFIEGKKIGRLEGSLGIGLLQSMLEQRR